MIILITVATDFASIVFPVPGGPKRRTPFQGLLIPINIWGIKIGSNTASYNISLAVSNSAISSNLTLGFLSTTSLSNLEIKS